ncbi:MAG: hypothetical protein WA919_04445 [Coleofasciculaceae cyanobacterium]
MMVVNIFLLGMGLWAVVAGLKVCEQVHGIALVLTGLILTVWGLALAPLWLQIFVELLLISLVRFFLKIYKNQALKAEPVRAIESNCVEII